MNLKIASHSWRRFAILLTLCLGLAGLNPAAASIIYDFSLPSNGSVGAVDIQLTFSTLVTAGGGLNVYSLDAAPVTSVSSGTIINAVNSVVGFTVDAGSTLFGIALMAPPNPNPSSVLFTPSYPADFFSFTRTANQTGTFTAMGNVTSSLALSTGRPTATLVVTNTSAVPEPRTASLLAFCLIGIAGRELRRRSA